MPTNNRNIRLRPTGSRRPGSNTSTSRLYNTNSPRLSSHLPRTGPNRQSHRLKKGGQRRGRGRQRGRAVKGAQNQLKRFKQASILAVALTGFLLLLLTPGEAGYSQEEPAQEVVDDTAATEILTEEIPDSVAIIEEVAVEDLVSPADVAEDTLVSDELLEGEDIGKAARNEALFTLQKLWDGLYSNLPKILVAIATLILTWMLVKLVRFILRKTIGRWHSAGAVITLVGLSIWLLAIGIAISVVAGDIRALVGSLGLIGLALSWSLQTPIESFTGWLLNSFRSYYRVGDRISVGEVFGDVYKIDFLTTTVWEIGAPYRPGFVQAEQPTGRLVTFPNNEVLAGTIVNLTGDFPYVWDELSIAVANESDFREAMAALEKIASEILGDYMKEPAHQYRQTLLKAGLDYQVADKPQVFLNISESWTDIIIRYLVGARERRKWKSELSLRIIEELSKPEFSGKIKAVYPRQQVQVIDPDGLPVEAERLQPKPQPKEK
ncbi:mechanosensitive ion channel family protein [Nafulsella turpanensis]|uniref:mechanosensitive ion channel family protein n=1 Tax=Nafulsella turpanensis TaxID=1265690 RepID=UPI000345D0A9|nr:mechanosensitive ion channel domain-containing protein [Nafulsella turpanensis]